MDFAINMGEMFMTQLSKTMIELITASKVLQLKVK